MIPTPTTSPRGKKVGLVTTEELFEVVRALHSLNAVCIGLLRKSGIELDSDLVKSMDQSQDSVDALLRSLKDST